MHFICILFTFCLHNLPANLHTNIIEYRYSLMFDKHHRVEFRVRVRVRILLDLELWTLTLNSKLETRRFWSLLTNRHVNRPCVVQFTPDFTTTVASPTILKPAAVSQRRHTTVGQQLQQLRCITNDTIQYDMQVFDVRLKNWVAGSLVYRTTSTRNSAAAEEPCDALRQLKYYGRFLTELLTRSSSNAERLCEHTVSWNRVKICTIIRRIAFENVCKRWMTFKVIQGHSSCYHLIGHILFPNSLPL